MNASQLKTISPTLNLFKHIACAAVLCAGALSARAFTEPDVPAALEVPDGNKVHFHGYAAGVQIYTWQGAGGWVFKAPEAVLYGSPEDEGEIAIHYAGPTWESNSGSMVVGSKVAGATVDPSAIPWLLLAAKSNDGPGIFAKVTYIQRVNTVGGLAPSASGTAIGQEARVPYTAEYYFYVAH
jgi:hypothetical protein